ncbi:hypothetical protein ACFWU3_29540 [Streptomyces sp. NPDC058685]|uniref:hypothetical protein n=1 Tax=Streptomyces sp. NPDC058685 TaxID=3346598 RepID=UPI003666889D
MPSSNRRLDAAEASKQPDLDQLMILTAQGDQEAFAQVYDQVNGRVLGLALRVVRNAALFGDVDLLTRVVQEVG